MNKNERPERNIHPKFELIFKDKELERFETDSEGGPVVGFVRGSDGNVRLVTLEHDLILDSTHGYKEPIATVPDEPEILRYTPEEWVAFYSDAKDGEFQDLYDRSYPNFLKDSKQTDGPTFVIWSRNWRPWMDAIRRGKYDVPKGQEELIFEKFEENDDRQQRQVTKIIASANLGQKQKLNIKFSQDIVNAGTLISSNEITWRIANASGGKEERKERLTKFGGPRELHGRRNGIK